MTSSTHLQENLDILTLPPAVNVPLKDGGLVISSSCTTFQDSHKPDKKKPRKWAGWTRQEEETFFHALRQVGKNFEKITTRVRSKNKDQVRHYYYRLVRRMNKLLGPQLCLDAKNSKETVAAMLRWWSLLEKFSCSFTKLRVKPRRFKIFVETLENQLLKDRNKTRRKRCSQGESCLDTSSTSPNDARPGKLIAMDLQNSQKNGAGKVTSLRRNAGSSASSNKGDLPTNKTVRQKRGGVASAAYRRWEKAAMAGVALVADAAEQMERTANEDRNGLLDLGNCIEITTEICSIDGPRVISSVGKAAHGLASSELMLPCQIRDTTVQPSMKLKLQLFPIDEGTRKALEKDAHNPHLELTLSARKRISSVLEHLNRKWGNSTIGMGELTLLPYSFPPEDKATQQRWTARDTDASTADVYASVGSPSIFRLRYGWFSRAEVGSGMAAQFENQMLGHARDALDAENLTVEPVEHDTATYHISDTESSNDQSPSGVLQSVVYGAKSMCGGSADCKDGPRNSFEEMPSSCLEITVGGNCISHPQDKLNLEMRNNATFSAGDWADSLTTISVGDLLSEVSQAARRDCEQNPVSCDSFDAAIALHASGLQRPNLSTEVSHASIWNAEETCDAFSFQKFPPFKGKSFRPLDTSIGPCREVTPTTSLERDAYATDIPESGTSENPSRHNLKAGLGSAKEMCSEYNSSENVCTPDIYWPDSLGSFEIEVPSSGYQENDLTFVESVSFGGLSRLIANSVDAFQNCSFFGMDKKDISAGEARGVSVLLGNKMGSED